MVDISSFVQDLTESEIAELKCFSESVTYGDGELVFSEGDKVDAFYIIENGEISIFVDKCGKDEPICILSSGDFFGEMAIFNKDRRAASAMAVKQTVVLSIDKDRFLSFVKSHPVLAEKINSILSKRNEELLLMESVVGSTGISGEKFHVSIKGDPSLRESAFSRDRYESVVDKLLDQLIPVLEDLLLNRCVYSIFINFNSGEVRLRSIFDPFNEEIHTANKLTSSAYIDRHFSAISYAEKAAFIKRIYSNILDDTQFTCLPNHLKNVFSDTHKDWAPLSKEEISNVIVKLKDLRSIQSFYLRNFGISMIQDAIRMQFNCDGTHFVSSDDYHKFLEENLM
ncbi:MAG: cyclic nucleotide-binding domain-containing protein [Gammaproteobacteria bacterium]|nr:cyclic nucleotide-binding domain-containing protein [Gammaproteobacteria bacterium]